MQRIRGRIGTLVAMGMIARNLPKFRWFQSRPKTAWCCRWVLGGVTFALIAVMLLSFYRVVGLWMPHWMRVDIVAGKITFFPDLVTSSGESVCELIGIYTPGFMVAPGLVAQTKSVTITMIVREAFALPAVQIAGRAPDGTPFMFIRVPIWLLQLLAAPPAFAAWRNRWIVKREVGTCPACGYSRTGLAPSAPCPECGQHPVARA